MIIIRGVDRVDKYESVYGYCEKLFLECGRKRNKFLTMGWIERE